MVAPSSPTHPLAAYPVAGARRRRQRRARRWLSILAAAGAVAGVATWLGTRGGGSVSSACTVSGDPGTTYQLTPAQGQNAAIIAGVAMKQGLPDHAVTVALATALQESKLQNLDYGDRDSVGLFQQRPSQGWGTRAQILDPVYATSAFYGRLEAVPGWTTMAVTDAAQAVQLSGSPGAYAQWEPEARALAVALTGERAAAFTCRLAAFAGAAPAPAALSDAAAREMGATLIGSPVSAKTGWAVASWAVAHAWQYHLHQVTFGGWTWTAASGRWHQASSAATSAVVEVK